MAEMARILKDDTAVDDVVAYINTFGRGTAAMDAMDIGAEE